MVACAYHLPVSRVFLIKAPAPIIAMSPFLSPDGRTLHLVSKNRKRCSSRERFVGFRIRSPAVASPPERMIASGLRCATESASLRPRQLPQDSKACSASRSPRSAAAETRSAVSSEKLTLRSSLGSSPAHPHHDGKPSRHGKPERGRGKDLRAPTARPDPGPVRRSPAGRSRRQARHGSARVPRPGPPRLARQRSARVPRQGRAVRARQGLQQARHGSARVPREGRPARARQGGAARRDR